MATVLKLRTDSPSSAAQIEHKSNRRINFEDYDIDCHQGSSRVLLLAFTSLGDPGVLPKIEWRATVNALGGTQHTLYVRDRARSWYNSDNGWDAMIQWIRDYCVQHRIDHVYSFGVSMGGFGAAIAAAYLPITHVLMLSPQAMIGEEAAFDTRYRDFWDQLATLPRPNLTPCAAANTRFTCVFTADNLDDTRHAAAIQDMIPHCAMVPVHGDHNIANELRDRREIVPLIGWLLGMRGDPGVSRAGTSPASAFHFARLESAGQRDEIQHAVDQYVIEGRERACPGFVYDALDKALFHKAAQQHPSYSATRQAHAYPAQVGTTVVDCHVAPYRADGWSDDEYYGYWSLGDKAVIRAFLIDGDSRAETIVRISGCLFIAPGASRTLRISQNGRTLFQQGFHNDETHSVNLPLSVSLTVDGPLVELLLETPDPVAVSAVSESTDDRLLGFWLQRLSFCLPRATADQPSIKSI